MKYHKYSFFLFCLVICPFLSFSQESIERLLYLDSVDYVTILDPGDELLRKNLLIGNGHRSKNIEFNLSFDGDHWTTFVLRGGASSIFSMKNYKYCYSKIKTLNSDGSEKGEKKYGLRRGERYQIFWNGEYWCIKKVLGRRI